MPKTAKKNSMRIIIFLRSTIFSFVKTKIRHCYFWKLEKFFSEWNVYHQQCITSSQIHIHALESSFFFRDLAYTNRSYFFSPSSHASKEEGSKKGSSKKDCQKSSQEDRPQGRQEDVCKKEKIVFFKAAFCPRTGCRFFCVMIFLY